MLQLCLIMDIDVTAVFKLMDIDVTAVLNGQASMLQLCLMDRHRCYSRV